LDGLNELPGRHPDGALDVDYLREWVRQVRSLASAADRSEICDLTLGQFVARGSQKAHGVWPSPELAKLMEQIGTDDFFDGFVNGVLNTRGVVQRDASAGGESERVLVARYQELAAHARQSSGKLANAFLELARHYEAYARHEDDEAGRQRLGR
jgi:hypothetical protein